MASSSFLDFQKFAALLKTRRSGRGLRQVAEEIGDISASTLSRIEQGNVPDLETFMRLCHWLRVSADEFRSVPQALTGNLPETEEIIEAHLRADRMLPPEAINALSQMIRFAYRAAKSGDFREREG